MRGKRLRNYGGKNQIHAQVMRKRRRVARKCRIRAKVVLEVAEKLRTRVK